MKAILTILLIVSLWITLSAGMNYARSTASAAYIVSAISRYQAMVDGAEFQKLEGEVARKLKGIRSAYVPLAYGGGVAVLLCIVGLIMNGKRGMPNRVAPTDPVGQPPAPTPREAGFMQKNAPLSLGTA